MILYASQRSGAGELGKHLLNGDDNDHVTVHEIRGFVSDTLAGALQEAHAMSRGTRCRQFLFSLSLNPPEYADVPIEDFEAAIEEIEKKLLLAGQPRIVVFHEKNGRRHCHCVWSRIDTENLVAVNMAHFKRKLIDVSRGLFLKYGWKMPKGMLREKQDGIEKPQPRSPPVRRSLGESGWHLTREEYRQSVRLSENPQAMKALFKSAWEQSDSKATFIRALEERGFLLARGDRRGFVAMDVKGGIYSLSRWIDIGTRELKARLGKPESLPTLEQAKEFLAGRMGENLNRFIKEAKRQAKEVRLPLVQEIRSLVAGQRKEREVLIQRQQQRWQQETRQRTARLPRGVKGIWHKATGEYKKVRLLNEAETKSAIERDRKELHALVRSHLLERQELQKTVNTYKEEHKAEALRLRQEIARYVSTATEPFSPPASAKAAPAQKMPLAVQLEKIEARITALSGDMTLLQGLLENALLSDDMRGRIRKLIEKTLETLHLKAAAEKTQKQQTREKTRDYERKQAEFTEYVRRYAEIQHRIEEENRKIAANKQFYSIIQNMGYALNGIPRWEIRIMPPPDSLRLDEKAYTKTLRQQSNADLLSAVFRRPEIPGWQQQSPSGHSPDRLERRPLPPPRPETAVPELRQGILQVKEVLRRAGVQPPSGGINRMAPAAIKMTAVAVTKASVKFNAQRRPR